MVKLKGHVEPVYKRNKPYKCIVCDVCFAAKGNLEQHLALHSNSFIGMGKKVIAPLQGPAPLDRASGIRAAGGAMAPLDYDIIRTKTGVIKRPSINACPLEFSDFPQSLVESPKIETPEPSDEDKVKKILKGSLDPIIFSKNSNYWRENCLRCKGKTLLGVVNKLLKTKSLLTSPSNVLHYYLK